MIRRILDVVPLTALGVLALLMGWEAAREFGTRRQDLILYVAGWGLLGLGALATLLVIGTAVALRLGWRARPRPHDGLERVEAGAIVHTGFSLPSLSWLPFVSLRWEWLEPSEVRVRATPRGGRLREAVVHGERGEQDRTVRRLVVEDVLGLSRLALRLVEPGARVVLPARGRPPTAPLLHALAGGDAVSYPLGPPDGDLVEMRRYAPGDPMKRVLWKTFARTRTLMVRVPERAVSPTRRTISYLVAGDGDEAPASIARMALENDTLGPEWRFGADGSTEDACRLAEALPLIVRSRSARDHGGEGLGAFLERAADFGAGRCVIFAPGRPGPWLAVAAAALRRRAGRVEVIVGVDGVRDPAAEPRLRRWLFRREEGTDRAVPCRELDEVTHRLGAAGAAVMVVDRASGRVHRQAMRRRAS
jgi:uncharacterized protein DUF58